MGNERPWEKQGKVIYERRDMTTLVWAPLISCGLVGGGIGILGMTISWGWLGMGFSQAGLLSGSFGVLATSVLLILRFGYEAIGVLEMATGVDIDKNGRIGRKPIIVKGYSEKPSAKEDLRQQLVLFIKGCEGDTSRRRWVPAFLSRARYEMFRDTLIEANFADWDGDGRNAGWKLIMPSEEIIERLN